MVAVEATLAVVFLVPWYVVMRLELPREPLFGIGFMYGGMAARVVAEALVFAELYATRLRAAAVAVVLPTAITSILGATVGISVPRYMEWSWAAVSPVASQLQDIDACLTAPMSPGVKGRTEAKLLAVWPLYVYAHDRDGRLVAMRQGDFAPGELAAAASGGKECLERLSPVALQAQRVHSFAVRYVDLTREHALSVGDAPAVVGEQGSTTIQTTDLARTRALVSYVAAREAASERLWPIGRDLRPMEITWTSMPLGNDSMQVSRLVCQPGQAETVVARPGTPSAPPAAR